MMVASITDHLLSAEWRAVLGKCLGEIALLQGADQSCMEEEIHLLERASKAQTLYLQKQPAPEKRQLLSFVLSNCVLKDGQLTAKFKQPFDLLAETTVAIEGVERPKRTENLEKAIGWGARIRT